MTGQDVVYEVVSALAAAENVNVQELDFNLSEYVDTDALVTLAETSGDWELSFEAGRHSVHLTHDGQTYVDGVAYRNGAPVEEPSPS